MRGLDTNVLVRYLTADDANQFARAQSLLARAEGRGDRFLVNVIVLCELVWTLRGVGYRYDRPAIASALEQIAAAPLFEFQHRDQVLDAIHEFRRGKADFADYLIGEMNVTLGCSDTLTFDNALKSCSAFAPVPAEP